MSFFKKLFATIDEDIANKINKRDFLSESNSSINQNPMENDSSLLIETSDDLIRKNSIGSLSTQEESDHNIKQRKQLFTKYKSHEYKDFDTIDWLAENNESKKNLLTFRKEYSNKRGFFKKLYLFFFDISGWLCIIIMGLIIGSVSSIISIVSEWLNDIRIGYCSIDFSKTYSDCCWLNNVSSTYSDSCIHWKTWSDMVELKSKGIVAVNIFNFIIYVFFSVNFAFLAAFLTKWMAPYASGSGITEIKTILNGFTIYGFLGLRTSVFKYFSLILSTASGLDVSYEGGLVHISSSISNLVTRWFYKFKNNESKKREVIGAGACAGFASVLSAPISGLLFGLEEICYYFPPKAVLRTFCCVLVANFTLIQLRSSLIGYPQMYLEYHPNTWNSIELIPIFLLSIICGILGILFNKLVYFWSNLRRKSFVGRYPISEVVFLCFLSCIVTFPFYISRQGNHRLLFDLYKTCRPYENNYICDYEPNFNIAGKFNPLEQPVLLRNGVYDASYQLVIIGFLKLILASITISMKIPTGFIIPLAVIGACFGRSAGIFLEILTETNKEFNSWFCFDTNRRCISPALYSLIGSTALLASVTHWSITLVVLIIELTNSSIYIVPIMLSAMVSKAISRFFGKLSLTQTQIKINNYPFLDRLLTHIDDRPELSITKLLKNIVINKNLIVLYLNDMSLSDINHILEMNFYGYPLVKSEHETTLIGYVKRNDLLSAIKKTIQKYSHTDEEDLDKKISFDIKNYNQNVYNLSECVDFNFFRLDIDSKIESLAELFESLGIRNVLITSHGKLISIVTKKDFLEYLFF